MFHILNIWALFMGKVAFMQYVFPFRYTQCVCVFFKITTQLMESWCRSRCLEVLPTPPLRPWRGSGGGGGDLRLSFPQQSQAAGFDMQEPQSWDLRSEAALLLLQQQPRCASCEPSSNQAGGCRSPFPPPPPPSPCSSDLSPSPRRHVCQRGFAALISTS